MSTNELLGSDNQNRVKELAKDSYSAVSIFKNLVAEDPSLRRDAALAVLDHHLETPSLNGAALVAALAETLRSPGAARNAVDDLAWATSAEAALAALYAIDAGPGGISDALLRSVIPYTEASQPWTTAAAAATAERLLDKYRPGAEKQEFVIGGVLQSYLRPVFSKSTSAVTAQGRPVLFREPQPDAGFHAQKAAWKEVGPHIVTIFDWAVDASEPATIKKHWPLYVPVLVTLTEDDDVVVRQRGLEILGRFLVACPANVLRTSGIDAVFAASVLPSLLFLPSLTPEAESVVLLRAAYGALRALALAADADPAARRRRALLDRTLREGVLAGYFHASQHMRVVEVLMRSAAQIVEALQIYAVKHLQNLLDLFTPVLTDAFALAYPPAVVATAEALNTTILNCWPRIVGTPHAEHIISVASRCWINVQGTSDELGGPEQEALTAELKKTMTLVASLWREADEAMPMEKLAQMVQMEPSLKSLLVPFQLEKSMA